MLQWKGDKCTKVEAELEVKIRKMKMNTQFCILCTLILALISINHTINMEICNEVILKSTSFPSTKLVMFSNLS